MDTPLSDSYLSFPRSVPQKCTVFKDSGNATSGTPVFRGRDAVAAVRRHTRTFGRMESSSSACTPRFSHRKGASRSSSCSYHPFTTPSSHGESSERTSGRTPGSVSTPAAVIPSVVVAIVEGRGLARGEIGMASIDMKRPELVLSQFSDSQSYVKVMTKLQILNPLEVIVPSTVCDSSKSQLLTVLSDHYSDVSVTTVQRKYFNETKGLQYIKQLCVPEYNTVEMEVSSKYYCLAAGAALLKYVEFIQNMVYAAASLKVVFRGSEQTTMIDTTTVKNLEILVNSRDSKSPQCLFGVLNHTKTALGARLLRANLLQPPSDVETISLRLDCVAELIEKEDLYFRIQGVLVRFLDVERALASCVQIPKQETVKTAEHRIANVIDLKHTLELVEPLRDALRDGENSLLVAYEQSLDDPRYKLMIEEIDTVIHAETCHQKGALNKRTQKCFAVKSQINGLLDIARRTYTELVDDIATLVKQLAEQHQLPLRVTYNASRGFFIQMSTSGATADSLPSVFLKIVKSRSTLNFTTEDLIKLNDRVAASLTDIYLISNTVMLEVMCNLRAHIGCLYKLTECVAMLDMLVSFAHACTLSNYIRPEFTDTLALKQARHPILDRISDAMPVANNTYASGDCNFQIITGPNMSGKSTYLKQVVLCQIMAQIGSFVPAEYASFRLTSQIFSRIGSDDDIETNASTFLLEERRCNDMREANYIVQNASNDSLIIVDELGRGTSADEGLGLCHSICEYLLNLKAFTFFATHFLELTNLDALYPNVENYHFEVQRSFNTEGNCENLDYTHVMSKGKTNEKHYGIRLAGVSSMPKTIIDEAKEMSASIAENSRLCQQQSPGSMRERAVFKLASRLIQAARNSRLDEVTLRSYLANLKRQYEIDTSETSPPEE
ncbi:mutS protein homolog 4-like [Corticium candelabrum]|uniref:mutS protein homolog 4-like n=1 Tax=Corticium candelabrum TaxID=121492 RepID=UPI002E26CA4E|nr:mutS protein homolog 4-like [Corticium candelabrum]